MFARVRIEPEKGARAIVLGLAQQAALRPQADSAHERAERLEGAAHRNRFVDREIRRLGELVAFHRRQRWCRHANAGYVRCDRSADFGRNVGYDLRRPEAHDLGQHLIETVLAAVRRGGGATGGDVRIGYSDRLAGKGNRGQIVVACAIEQVLLDQRTGGHHARNVAAHELVRHRKFELVGERHDALLRDEVGEIFVERVIRHAGHRDALAAARLL